MTGKGQAAGGRRQEAGARSQETDGRRHSADARRQTADGRRQEPENHLSYFLVPGSCRLPPAICRLPPGFTLLELMIVITIIIILAAIALPQYQKTIMHAREAVLRDDLFKMRSLIDQYAADKAKLPQDLEDLVKDGYMRELPVDPITGNNQWELTLGDDPNSTSGETGVTNIHSKSTDTSSEGTPYSEW